MREVTGCRGLLGGGLLLFFTRCDVLTAHGTRLRERRPQQPCTSHSHRSRFFLTISIAAPNHLPPPPPSPPPPPLSLTPLHPSAGAYRLLAVASPVRPQALSFCAPLTSIDSRLKTLPPYNDKYTVIIVCEIAGHLSSSRATSRSPSTCNGNKTMSSPSAPQNGKQQTTKKNKTHRARGHTGFSICSRALNHASTTVHKAITRREIEAILRAQNVGPAIVPPSFSSRDVRNCHNSPGST